MSSWLTRLGRTVPGLFTGRNTMSGRASSSSSWAQEHRSSHEPRPEEKTDAAAVSDKLKPFSGFFKKDMKQRQELLGQVAKGLDTDKLTSGGLEPYMADVMVENCIGMLGLPVGVAPTFVVNGKHYVVPMCVEEPSVVAAASGIGKLVAKSGGFTASSTRNVMTGQIQLLELDDVGAAAELISRKEKELVALANKRFCASMVRRGGGVLSLDPRVVKPRYRRAVSASPYLVVHVHVDTCEAMGANLINTVAEGLAPHLEKLTGARAGLKILTNLCAERRTVSTFRIPLDKLAWKGVEGRMVADRILEAFYLSEDDSFRATTNNKGIMNGMDAVAIATGQDWRAIEASAHAYALRVTDDGRKYYGPLAQYSVQDTAEGPVLEGRMEIPIAVGTVGGALQTHPLYKLTHKLLGKPNSKELSQIIVSVGLAQNFAAMRALAIEGIQRGHMALHARNVAVAAGVPPELVSEVTSHMVRQNKIHQDVAREYMRSRAVGGVQNQSLRPQGVSASSGGSSPRKGDQKDKPPAASPL